MSRRHFRSQPALQRSGGGHVSSAIFGLVLLAAIGMGVGALIREFADEPAPEAAMTYPGQSMDAAATLAPAPTPSQTGPAAPQAPPLEATPEPPAAPPMVKVKSTAPAKASRMARPQPVPAPGPAAPQVTWEQQRQDYERARAAYDASERTAGRRWAQENKIRTARYCRTAAQRTPAFLEGCMSYLAPARSGGSARPADQAPAAPREDG
jgi:hypothetical protein